MTLYLLRHGEYHYTGQETADDDRQLPLSQDGASALERHAATLAAWKLPVDTIQTSPFVRAKQTAEIVGAALHLPVQEHAGLTRTEFNLANLEQLLAEYPDSQHLLLVGHEPDFSTVTAAITGGGTVEIARGGLLRIELESNIPVKGRLIWLLPPVVLDISRIDDL